MKNEMKHLWNSQNKADWSRVLQPNILLFLLYINVCISDLMPFTQLDNNDNTIRGHTHST